MPYGGSITAKVMGDLGKSSPFKLSASVQSV